MVIFTTVACRISSRLKWYKNCKNWSRLAKVIVKNKMSLFYGSLYIMVIYELNMHVGLFWSQRFTGRPTTRKSSAFRIFVCVKLTVNAILLSGLVLMHVVVPACFFCLLSVCFVFAYSYIARFRFLTKTRYINPLLLYAYRIAVTPTKISSLTTVQSLTFLSYPK